MRDNSSNYREIFLSGAPMMDARAPVEFSKGAFPGVVNLPLMNDLERQKVGTCYKQKGQQAAIELGHSLVCGQVKAERVAQWAAFAQANPLGYLYCFRGGLRSQLVQQWLKEAGIDYPRVIGGYKAMRSFLLETIEQAVTQCDFVVVGGLTGTGKTDVLAALANQLDLEGHANHRGSSFGKRATAQPGQIDFENSLAIDILRKRAAGIDSFVLEDESRLVGRCSLPHVLHLGMQQFPLVWLEDTLDGRVQRILRDYVIDLCSDFIALHGEEQGFSLFSQRMLESMANIQKRLGGERYQRLLGLLQEALRAQQASGDTQFHIRWIEALLVEYYDPMYAFQRTEKADRLEFSGSQAEVVDYLQQRNRSADT